MGLPEDQSSCWSELAGILDALSFLDILCHLHDITAGNVTIVLDSESAIDRSRDQRIDVAQTSFNHLQVIHAQISSLSLTIKWKRVEGHQQERGVSDSD